MLGLHTGITATAFATFAEVATYTAPGGAVQGIHAVLVERTQIMSAGGYVEERPVIHVLQAELARPVIGATVVIGNVGWVIDRPPDALYGIWQLVVRRAW